MDMPRRTHRNGNRTTFGRSRPPLDQSGDLCRRAVTESYVLYAQRLGWSNARFVMPMLYSAYRSMAIRFTSGLRQAAGMGACG
jgi:hypothetical protein